MSSLAGEALRCLFAEALFTVSWQEEKGAAQGKTLLPCHLFVSFSLPFQSLQKIITGIVP